MPLDLTTLNIGDEVHHPLMIADIMARGGDHPRTTLLLGNASGRIESAPFWAGKDEALAGLSRGMLVQVVGRVANYRDSRQLEVASLRPLPPGSIPLEELLPSVGPTDKYWAFIDETRARLTATRLRAALDLFFADEAFRLRFQACPGAPGVGHHAALGGLLQHTCEVMSIARQIARLSRADEELVLAGAMLHDIGKVQCYTWETGIFDTTLAQRLAGHVTTGVMMFRSAWEQADPQPCTAEEAMILEHFILSHHGKLEFGAPVRPATLEAEILSYADEASAGATSFREAFDNPEYFPARDTVVSVKSVWELDRRRIVKIEADFGRSNPDHKNEAADQEG